MFEREKDNPEFLALKENRRLGIHRYNRGELIFEQSLFPEIARIGAKDDGFEILTRRKFLAKF